MPLSDVQVDRDPIHTRAITVNGFRRADGLWDIEARMADTKAYGFDLGDKGWLDAGSPIHDMRLRLTLDDSFTIRAVEAVTDAAPFHVCAAGPRNMARRVGLTIGAGWMREVKRRVGGVDGCTHHTELLPVVATAAMQTMGPILAREKRERDQAAGQAPDTTKRPRLLNSCHAFDEHGPVVARQWPNWHTPAADRSADG